MTSASRRVLLIAVGLLLAVSGYLLLLSYNAAGGVLVLGALVCVALSFRRFAWAVVAAMAATICFVAAWATLGGGAEEWTAAPWIVAALVFSTVSILVFRRRLRKSQEGARPAS